MYSYQAAPYGVVGVDPALSGMNYTYQDYTGYTVAQAPVTYAYVPAMTTAPVAPTYDTGSYNVSYAAPNAGMNFGNLQTFSGPEKGSFYKTRLCTKFKEGLCPYGDACRYAHGESELRQASVTGHGSAMPAYSQMNKPQDRFQSISALKKTQLCRDFTSTGACKYGDKCSFAHGQHELRTATTVRSDERPNLRKTSLCTKFMESGSCPFGANCKFAHGEAELRARPAGAPPPSVLGKRPMMQPGAVQYQPAAKRPGFNYYAPVM